MSEMCISEWGFVRVGFCPSGVLSEWGFVRVGYVRWGYVRWGFVFEYCHLNLIYVCYLIKVLHMMSSVLWVWQVLLLFNLQNYFHNYMVKCTNFCVMFIVVCKVSVLRSIMI